MPRYTQDDASCSVFTYKEGLLAKIAHDLEIEVTRFRVEATDGPAPEITAEFDAHSLRVRHAMRDGQPAPALLSEADKDKIGSQIVADVLHSGKHPQIRFVSTSVTALGGGALEISGELTLHGVTRPITTRTESVPGGGTRAAVQLHQPDFGIVPFRALMGTLKVQPTVEVRLTIPG